LLGLLRPGQGGPRAVSVTGQFGRLPSERDILLATSEGVRLSVVEVYLERPRWPGVLAKVEANCHWGLAVHWNSELGGTTQPAWGTSWGPLILGIVQGDCFSAIPNPAHPNGRARFCAQVECWKRDDNAPPALRHGGHCAPQRHHPADRDGHQRRQGPPPRDTACSRSLVHWTFLAWSCAGESLW
jgi:hypothetical protein